MGKAFYDAETPEEAIEIYLKGDSDLYGRMKNKVIEGVLCSMIPSWNTLKVLEVGAGGGAWTEFFITHGADVTCVDLCKPILEGNAKLHPEANFILADATTVKLKKKFDLIFAKDIIEHIEDDLLFLENMNEHLREGGLLLINTQNAFSLNYLIEGGWHFLRGKKKWCGWDPTHVRFYTPKSLKKKLQMTGFEIDKWFGSYHFPYKFITGMVFGKVLECNLFHPIESTSLYDKLPFSITGWGIGVVAKKTREVGV